MDKYIRHISGIFSHREDAESAFSRIIKKGLPYKRLQIFESGTNQDGKLTDNTIRQLIQQLLITLVLRENLLSKQNLG